MFTRNLLMKQFTWLFGWYTSLLPLLLIIVFCEFVELQVYFVRRHVYGKNGLNNPSLMSLVAFPLLLLSLMLDLFSGQGLLEALTVGLCWLGFLLSYYVLLFLTANAWRIAGFALCRPHKDKRLKRWHFATKFQDWMSCRESVSFEQAMVNTLSPAISPGQQGHSVAHFGKR